MYALVLPPLKLMHVGLSILKGSAMKFPHVIPESHHFFSIELIAERVFESSRYHSAFLSSVGSSSGQLS